MTYHIVHRTWRVRRAIWILMALELAGLIPVLVLFGIEQPDLYRSKFWQIGYDNGLNSNPNMILYAYANHRELPTVPFVWSQTLTNFNVALSVLVLFFLLVKLIAFIMKLWFPIIATVINFAMVALWTTSVYGQIGPDHADDRYPSNVAWYIRLGCDIAKPYDAVSLCRLAKGTLALTVYMLFLFLCNLGLSIYSMLPNELNNQEEEEDGEKDDSESVETGKGNWEMQSIGPASPRGPFTPRTTAFRTLDRKAPSQGARFA